MGRHDRKWSDLSPQEKADDFDEMDEVLTEVHRHKPYKKVGNSTVADKELTDNKPRRWWTK